MAPRNPRNYELRKAVLIPLWIGQLCPLGVFLALIIIALTAEPSWTFLYLIAFLMAGCILCNIVEIVLFAKHKLRPTPYLIMQIVKAKIWLVLWVITMIPSMFDVGNVICTSTLSAVFLGSLIYAAVIVHRQRRLKNSPFTFNPGYPRRVSKDSIFGDQVELVRPASVLISKLDRRYRDVGA